MMKGVFAILAAVAVGAAPVFAQEAREGDFEEQARGIVQAAREPAGIKDWFKSAADKAGDADKIEFMRSEGEAVEDGYFINDGASMRLTDRGAAVFNRMKAVFNEQAGLLDSGYQKISAEEGRMLESIQRVVNLRISHMRESCRSMDFMTHNNALSVSCGFISDAGYAHRSGRSSFASPEGLQMLQAISGR